MHPWLDQLLHWWYTYVLVTYVACCAATLAGVRCGFVLRAYTRVLLSCFEWMTQHVRPYEEHPITAEESASAESTVSAGQAEPARSRINKIVHVSKIWSSMKNPLRRTLCGAMLSTPCARSCVSRPGRRRMVGG